MGQVWDLDLPANKLLVLLALTDHADHNGDNIHPSMELVAWKTGYSERQVRRIVQGLVKDKILAAEKRPGKTTLFTAHLENGKQKEPFKRSNMVGQNVTPDIAMSDQVGHSYVRTTPDTQMSDEPSVKPSRTVSAPKPRPINPVTPWHDALLLCFNLKPDTVTKSADRTYWTAASELSAIKFPVEHIPDLYRWCVAQGWKTFSVMAMAKHAGEWLAKRSNNISVLDGLRIVS